jgi:hypothetical protein
MLIINRVYYRGSNVPLSPKQLAYETGFTFNQFNVSSRLSGGGHCDCKEGGEFELLPKDHPDVAESGKRYMQCRTCGGWSHL